jgi:hypothetical protein
MGPALGKLRLEGHEFETSLGYRVKPCLKKKRIMSLRLRFCFSFES